MKGREGSYICGIAGIYKYGKEPIREEMIALLLTGNEERGNDATGIALLQADGNVVVHKEDIQAWKFVTSNGYEKFIEEQLKDNTVAAILHTRAASQGNPRDNNNNHPMFAGKAAIVHNGVIRNDDTLFKELRLERKAATDSDIIRAIIDEYGFGELALKYLNKISGSVAGAAISPQHKNKLMIFKSGSPMALASTNNLLIFSSLKKSIHCAMRPIISRFGMPFQLMEAGLAFSIMPEHTVRILGPKGLEAHSEFKTQVGQYTEPNRRVHTDYEKRQEEFTNKQRAKGSGTLVGFAPQQPIVKLYPCSKCGKQWTLPTGENNPTTCVCDKTKGGCGEHLANTPIAVNIRRINS